MIKAVKSEMTGYTQLDIGRSNLKHFKSKMSYLQMELEAIKDLVSDSEKLNDLDPYKLVLLKRIGEFCKKIDTEELNMFCNGSSLLSNLKD